MQGIDLRMKEIGVKRLGEDTMSKLTDWEITEARCGTFQFVHDLAGYGIALEDDAIAYYFCEVFVKDIIARKEAVHG